MCLTSAALAVFLTLVGPSAVSLGEDRVIVHAQSRDAHWVAVESRWCTMAPQLDAMARLKAAKSQ